MSTKTALIKPTHFSIVPRYLHWAKGAIYGETIDAGTVTKNQKAIAKANGLDTVNLRWQNKNLTSIQIKVAEEQSYDSETVNGEKSGRFHSTDTSAVRETSSLIH